MNASLRRRVAEGFALLRQGRVVEARAVAESLVAVDRADPEAQFLASEARSADGDMEGALEAIVSAVAAAPAQIALRLKHADVLLGLGRRAEAGAVAEAAGVLAGNDAQSLCSIAGIFTRSEDPQRANLWFARALAIQPRMPAALHGVATTEFFLGQFERAEEHLDQLLDIVPRFGHACYLRATLRTQTAERNHVEDLKQRAAQVGQDAASKASILFALAKELEDLTRFPESFAALSEGAALKRSTLRYDAAGERAAISSIAEVYDPGALASIPDGTAEPGPIFIVGMPRTGTTLVERMLGHGQEVHPAGELLDFGIALSSAVRPRLARDPSLSPARHSLQLDFAALGRRYLASARAAAGGARRFIDKMPINFMYCGLILKALPGARIVHLVRDPMDTCYAVYKTLFQQAYHFSYDLTELADYFVTYRALMRHWHRVCPGQILDVHYERLVGDTEPQARRLLSWCDLPWRDEVLQPAENPAPSTTASAAQIRQPVHRRSVQKWRRYAAELEPLRRRLEAAGVVDGDGNPRPD